MIFVDDREGSRELTPYIPKKRCPVCLVRLEYGDVSFDGNGPEGRVSIGVERKVITDLLSSISTGRLSGHQLPGMLETYFRTYLVIEGYWRPATDGMLEIKKKTWYPPHGRKWRYTDVLAYLSTLEVLTGVIVRFTHNMIETGRVIESLYSWWSKPWERHRSHMALAKTIVLPTPLLRPGKAPLVQRVAAELPGVGVERAVEVGRVFKTVEQMVEATPDDWMELGGFGKVTAYMVWRALRGLGDR